MPRRTQQGQTDLGAGERIRALRPQLSPEVLNFMRLLAAAQAPSPGSEPPAENWMAAYRVRRCGCGTAVAAGGRCRGCGGPSS